MKFIMLVKQKECLLGESYSYPSHFSSGLDTSIKLNSLLQSRLQSLMQLSVVLAMVSARHDTGRYQVY